MLFKIFFSFADILNGVALPENHLDSMGKAICRQLRRWRASHHIEVRNSRIYIDQCKLIMENELEDLIKKDYRHCRGSSIKKLNKRIKKNFKGVSRKDTSTKIKALPEHNKISPRFDNVAPLKPVLSNGVHHIHQIDLVNMKSLKVVHKGITYQYVLSVMDIFSRYLWLFPLSNKNSKDVTHIVKHLYLREGAPFILQSDNGREFMGKLNCFCKKMGIKRIRGRPYHPQSQGKIEASHKTWRRKLMFDILHFKNKIWVNELTKYAYLRNTEYHEAIRATPFEVYHGRPVKSHRSTKFITATTGNDSVNSEKIRSRADFNARQFAKRMVDKHGKKRSPSVYLVKDKILVKVKSRGKVSSTLICEGIITEANYPLHKYKVKYALNDKSNVKWFSVTDITAQSLLIESERKKLYKHLPKKIKLRC